MGRALILTALAVLVPGGSVAGASSGFLTAPSERRPVTIALDYVSAHPERFQLDRDDVDALRLTRSYRSASGAVHLQWEQRYRGVPIFGSGLRANVTEDGRLINASGAPLPDPRVDSIDPRLPAPPGDDAHLTIVGDRLAWRVLQREDVAHVYDTVIDATNGETLYRANRVRQADALAFDNYPGAPLGGTQVPKTFSQAGDDPWLTLADRLAGDNAHVYSDHDDNIDGEPPDGSTVPADEIDPSAVGPPLAWNYSQDARVASGGQLCPAAGCTWNAFNATFSWTVNREQAGTQLFYLLNTFHDHLRDAPGIGFDDGSNNFEGADRVEAQVDDGAATGSGGLPDCQHANNAYVLPWSEGTPLLMQIFLWTSACFPGAPLNDVNAADDALIVYHEYTHGMTNRLVTLGDGTPGLNGYQPGAMDEGLADWYALDLLNAQGFEPDSAAPGELAAGKYEHDALRTQPFDCPVGASASACPGTPTAGSGGYTYGDFARVINGQEVHADGEIWIQTLWDLRARLIADHGAAAGILRARVLVTDGLRLAPANPTFLDMRNAILQADANRGLGDRDRIWAVFAGRGMGYRAFTSSANDTSPIQDFSLPPGPSAPPPPDTTAPAISRVSLSRKRFRVGQVTIFSFRLSEAATTEIVIERPQSGRRVRGRCRPATRVLRKRARCTRYARKGTLVRTSFRPGMQRVRFNGKIRRRALPPGAYRATIRATDAHGNRSRAVRLTFRIVRR